MGSSHDTMFMISTIRTRKTPTDPNFIGWLHVDDHYHREGDDFVAVRFNGGFRDADEILRVIVALKTLLPVIDRLGSIE